MDPATIAGVAQAWGAMSDYANSNQNKGKLKIGQYLYNTFKPDLTSPLSKAMSFDTSHAQGQFDAQRYDNYNATQIRVQDALRAGVNPSAVIGGSAGHVSPTISSGGSDYQRKSSGFGSMMAGIAELMAGIQVESAELDVESKRLQNDLLRQKVAVETQPGILTAGQASNPKWRIPMDYRLRDIKPGKMFLPWEDMEGNIHWFLNPDTVSDADYSNIEAMRALALGGVNYASSARRFVKRNKKRKTIEAVNALWY